MNWSLGHKAGWTSSPLSRPSYASNVARQVRNSQSLSHRVTQLHFLAYRQYYWLAQWVVTGEHRTVVKERLIASQLPQAPRSIGSKYSSHFSSATSRRKHSSTLLRPETVENKLASFTREGPDCHSVRCQYDIVITLGPESTSQH